MDERRISSTSQPYLCVSIATIASPSAKNKKIVSVGENKTSSTSRPAGNYLVIDKTYISSMEFDATQIGGRQGFVEIIDPYGWWTDQLGGVGAWRNTTPYAANMYIDYGWTNLNFTNNKIQTVQAMMLRTGFSVTEDGVVSIRIEFVESAENLINLIQFKTLDDMIAMDPLVHPELTNKSISDLLTYMTTLGSTGQHANNPGTISQQLKTNKITFQFAKTAADNSKYGADGRKLKVRIGDKLVDKMNELMKKDN